MFTPPPQSEADAVRKILGQYFVTEIVSAYLSQVEHTRSTGVSGIHLNFETYDNVHDYMTLNSPLEIARQIDWWTRCIIYSVEECLYSARSYLDPNDDDYIPSFDEIAQELHVLWTEVYVDDDPEIREEIIQHPNFNQYFRDLNWYARNSRTKAMELEA